MPTSRAIVPEVRTAGAVLLRVLGVAVGSLLLGGLTSFGQTVLPDALRPFANSASGWTLLTAVLVALCGPRSVVSAVLGAVAFVGLVIGFQITSDLRGFVTSETLWLVVGVLVGPFVGVAATWLRRRGLRLVLGTAALAGIAIGEGGYGLLEVAEHTGVAYWIAIGVAGLALLAVVATRRLRTLGERVEVVALTAAVATAFVGAYTLLGTV